MSLFCLPHKMLFDYSSQSICLYDGNVQICAAILFMISNGKSNNKNDNESLSFYLNFGRYCFEICV